MIKMVENRNILWGLAKNDFKSRYATSFLGIGWAFIQPLVSIIVMWYVFSVGFKNPPVNNYPFVAWFIPAFLSWTFFSDGFVSVTNSFREYEYLLKQVNFEVRIIPMIKVISSSFVHLAFWVVICVVMLYYKIPFSLGTLQVIYYFICACVLLFALGKLFATLSIFIPDTSSVVNVVVQIGFWATPIFWSTDLVTEQVNKILKINPMYYVCQGYRDSFLSHTYFWEHPTMTIVFWIEVIVIALIGEVFYRRMRPYLVDLI